MTTALILEKFQAEAIYNAMRALSERGIRTDKFLAWNESGDQVEIASFEFCGVRVCNLTNGIAEHHSNQAAFAAAYGLVHGGDKNAAALEQIARLGRDGTRDGQIIRDAMTEIAEKATAYGLNSDEPQSAVAAAAGGLTQTAIER